MITEFLLSVVFVALAIATVTDIYKREVPDVVTYFLVLFGFAANSILTVFYQDVAYIISSVAGFVLAFILGLILFYTAQWGGGDAKLIMGVGAVIGMPLSFEGIPFLVLFLINSFFIGAIYGILSLFVVAVWNFKTFSVKFIERLYKTRWWEILVYAISFTFFVSLGFLAQPFRDISLYYMTLVVFFHMMPFLLFVVRVVEQNLMFTERSVDELVPGDWIRDDIRGVDIKDRGVTEEQIEILKDTGVETVTVKEGVPFVPSFLIAFIVSVAFEELFSTLIL